MASWNALTGSPAILLQVQNPRCASARATLSQPYTTTATLLVPFMPSKFFLC